jgi:hypothetical protein
MALVLSIILSYAWALSSAELGVDGSVCTEGQTSDPSVLLNGWCVDLRHDVARIVKVRVAPRGGFLGGPERTEEPIANYDVA